MNPRPETTAVSRSAFISYSWDSDDHKKWTKELATRLRRDGVDVKLDQWETVPGDQLPAFMETAIRENDYVLIICTPKYKEKSDGRKGGVGYEGDIMTGEIFAKGNHRKFIPVLRAGDGDTAAPSWLQGKYGIDLRGNPYSEDQYNDLLVTIHDQREKAPPIGRPPKRPSSVRGIEDVRVFQGSENDPVVQFEPIKIIGVVVDEVGEPLNDASRGSALYAVPFKLSHTPPPDWADLFIRNWDHPPRCSTMHRPHIAEVEGNRIVLTRTTIDEVKNVHRETLKLAVEEANRQYSVMMQQRQQANEREKLRRQQHEQEVRRIAGEIDFD